MESGHKDFFQVGFLTMQEMKKMKALLAQKTFLGNSFGLF